MPTIRPRKPEWIQSQEKKSAQTALGEFTVKVTDAGFWTALLNDAPFPILYQNLGLALESAEIVARVSGHPTGIPLSWTQNSVGAQSAQSIVGTLHVVASVGIDGFFVMMDDDPARIPIGSEEEAKEACAQYLTYVWFALSEVV